MLLNASLLAPDLLPSGDIDAASLVNSQPEKPRVSPVAVASAHAVLAEAKRQRAVRDKQRKNRKGKKKKLLPVTEQLLRCRAREFFAFAFASNEVMVFRWTRKRAPRAPPRAPGPPSTPPPTVR